MYLAKRAAEERPRLQRLFEMERSGDLPKLHRQCSHSEVEKVVDNHLTCCLGVECRKCPELLALESMSPAGKPDIDYAKSWTCVGHILHESGKQLLDTSEGFILTTDDRIYWDCVYDSMAGYDSEEGG